MRKILFVVVLALCSLAAGCGGGDGVEVSESITPVAGNWTDCCTGEWCYGFYDDMAIADGKFWEYGSVEVTKSSAEIVLCRDGESKRVVLRRDVAADSLCRERKGLFSRPLVRANGYVSATGRDRRPMEGVSFTLDSVRVRGYFPDVESGADVELQMSNIIHNDRTFAPVIASIDSCGRFEAVLPCVCLSELKVVCDAADVWEWIYCAPGDEVMITYDVMNGRTLVMGEYARLYHENEAYERYLRDHDGYVYLDYAAPISHEAYLGQVRSEVEERGKRLLEDFKSANGNLSRRFCQMREASLLREVIDYASRRRFSLKSDGSDSLPECYAPYLDSVFAAIRPEFRMVWDDPNSYFLTRIGGRRGSKSYWAVEETLRYMDEQGIRPLSESERALFVAYNNGLKAMQNGATTPPEGFKAAADSINKIWTGNEVQSFVKEKGEKFIAEIVDVRMAIIDPLEMIVQSGVDKRFVELCAANIFMSDIYYRRHSMGGLWFATMDKYISDPVLRRCIEAENEKYLAIENRDMDYPASIVPSEPYALESDAEQLWRRIAERYKGKVVALDFWGTWCVPCREEMPAVKELAESYADEDVVFVFFACQSPEDGWLNIIRELKLTAPNIEHFNLLDAQMRLLVEKFGVTSYPTHILIDREGRVQPDAVPGLWIDDTALGKAIDVLLD